MKEISHTNVSCDFSDKSDVLFTNANGSPLKGRLHNLDMILNDLALIGRNKE